MTTIGIPGSFFLLNGDPKGVIKYTIANWTGIVYKIPRTKIDTLVNREDLSYSGVYFLIGQDDENQRPYIYVGKAVLRKNGKGVLNRVQEHMNDQHMHYWHEALILTTSDHSLGFTEVSYLENYFKLKTQLANRSTIRNGNDPSRGSVSEEKESELIQFANWVELIINANTSYNFLTPLVDQTLEDEHLLYLQTTTGLSAVGFESEDGFVVLSGASISPTITPSAPGYVATNRERYRDAINDQFITTEDLAFSSPSAAASFVTGTSISGPQAWKQRM